MLDALPIPVLKALRKLGGDVNLARRKRRISTKLLAERCGISRGTLTKVEKGDPAVGMGVYATVLFSLGLHGNLADVADIRNDPNGLISLGDELPQRIRG